MSTSFTRNVGSNENVRRLFLDNTCSVGDSEPKDCDGSRGSLALISGFG